MTTRRIAIVALWSLFIATVAAAGPFSDLKLRIATPPGFRSLNLFFTADHYQTSQNLDLIMGDANLLFRSLDENSGAFTADWTLRGSATHTPVTGKFQVVGLSYTFSFDVPEGNVTQNRALLKSEHFTGALAFPTGGRPFAAGTATTFVGSVSSGVRPFCAYVVTPQPVSRSKR